MRFTKPYLLVFSVVATLIIAAPVSAEPPADQPTEEDREQAAEYYAEAHEAYAMGQFDRAAELLARAFEREPDLIYRYNQTMAYLGLGDYEAGLALLDEYGDAMTADERFDDIAELRADLEDALSARQEREQARQAHEEEQAQRDADDDVQASVETPPQPKESSNILAWSLLGTGSAAFATGLFLSTGVLLNSHIDRLERSRTPEGERAVYDSISFERQDDLDILRSYRILSAVLLSTGALVGGTGGFLLWRNRNDSTDDESSSNLALEPMVTPDHTGAIVRGRF